MSSTIGVQNIAHTNGTVAATVSSGGNIAMASGKTFSATGAVVQVDNVTSFASTTGTTAMPFDDTIPQNNEGDEFLTLAFTPTSATNKLYINVHGHWGSTAVNSWLTVALFQDSISNAIAVSTAFDSIANGCLNHGLTHFMTAGTTSEITFKVRAGRNGSSTVRMNGTDGSRFFGGVLGSGITITEIGG
jgi:hypothetical protein